MIRWRVLVPPEHGVWGFLACGVIAALITAPSWPGVVLTLALTISVFFRHCLRRGLSTRDRELLTIAGWVGISGLGLLLAVIWLAPMWWWIPLVLAAPLAIGQFIREQTRRDQHLQRNILESLIGVTALATGGAAVALTGGAKPAVALQLFGIVSAYGACTVPYIRARLGRSGHVVSLLMHGLMLGIAWLAFVAGVSWVVVASALVLAGRAITAVYRPRSTPTAAGMEELLVSCVLAILMGIGLRQS